MPPQRAVYAEDYGTSYFKFGPVWIGKYPEMVENRGYFPKISKAVAEIRGIEARTVVVGPEVSNYLESREELRRLYYPMRNGVIDRDDRNGWLIVKELTRYGLKKFAPVGRESPIGPFDGFYVVAALAAQAPRYMYEEIFSIHEEINSEEGGSLVKAVTIIPQPLAVAIAEKATTCTVLEAGHGNTQITPISRDVIRSALIPLNRGGADSNAITAQILKDLGYGNLAREEKFVRIFKEMAGLVPINLDEAVEWAKSHPGSLTSSFTVPGTTVKVDMGEKAWQRFLIGEYFFNPGHEMFESYYSVGFTPPRDTVLPGETIPGDVSLAEAILMAVRKTPVEIQPGLLSKILLSGGAFGWRVPAGLEGIAADATQKLETMLRSLGVSTSPKMVAEPQFSVWRGSMVYGLYLPERLRWSWKSMEGWHQIS